MRRFKVGLLCLVLSVGGCRTLRTVGEVALEVAIPVAIIAGSVILDHEIWHHHHHHGHR